LAVFFTLKPPLVKDFRPQKLYPNLSWSRSDRWKHFLKVGGMFTGIIEHLGTVESLKTNAQGGRLTIHAPSLAKLLAVSNSIAVNGCCLTVVSQDDQRFSADLSGETLRKTSIGEWTQGTPVNLEQPLTAGKEFGGHMVLGHVDTIGRVARLEPEGENWWYAIEVPESFARYIVPQGSITIDGISLTVARWNALIAEIAVIPFTNEHTNIRQKKPGDAVNLEGDVLGKYVERYLEARGHSHPTSKLSVAELISQGF
jgi:riboflavin synthase